MSLSEAYEFAGDYKSALSYEQQIPDLMEQLYNEEKLEKRSEMIAKYESDKKAQENKLLQQKTELASAQLAKKNLTITLFVLVTVLIVFILFTVYRESKKKGKLNELLVQRNTEIELQKNQLEEVIFEKNNLMNIVAHDLRAPLDKVKGLSDLMRSTVDNPEMQQQCLDLIGNVTEQGRRLIDDLLTLSKTEAAELELKKSAVPVSEFIQQIVETYRFTAEKKSIELVCNEISQSSIVTDSDKLQRILDNLISNALKFSPMGKRIWISFVEKVTAYEFSVRDEGPGISTEDQEKMFRKFQKLSAQPTNGEPSTGLGLAIVKQLAVKLNGPIEVNSALGEGTTFRLVIQK